MTVRVGMKFDFYFITALANIADVRWWNPLDLLNWRSKSPSNWRCVTLQTEEWRQDCLFSVELGCICFSPFNVNSFAQSCCFLGVSKTVRRLCSFRAMHVLLVNHTVHHQNISSLNFKGAEGEKLGGCISLRLASTVIISPLSFAMNLIQQRTLYYGISFILYIGRSKAAQTSDVLLISCILSLFSYHSE